MTKALILAAGPGTRLKHFTKNKPKALVEIEGIAILEHQLKILIKNNINEIYIVIGFKGHLIKNYIKKNFGHLKIVFIENKVFYKTESSYSYYLAKKYLYNKSYFHINCDILFSNKTIKSLLKSKYTNLICSRKTGKIANNMHLIRTKNNLITKYENFFFHEDHKKIFGLVFIMFIDIVFMSQACWDHSYSNYKHVFLNLKREGSPLRTCSDAVFSLRKCLYKSLNSM